MRLSERPLSLPFRLSGLGRLFVAVCMGIAVALALARLAGTHSRFLAAWDVGVGVYLALAWTVIHAVDAHGTRARVQRQDQSGYVVFLLVVAAAYASLVAITWGLQEMRELQGSPRAMRVGLTMLALAESWLLIQTVFAFHYASAYYAPQASGDDHVRGLRFPGAAEPDYLDFLYYACVIGMTSQVADVAVSARHMWRLTLVHGVASFAFNLVILALGVNLVGGAIQ